MSTFLGRLALACLLVAFGAVCDAGIRIPAGGELRLHGAQLATGAGPVIVGGRLVLDGASLIKVGTLQILGSGVIDAGSGLMDVSGDWLNDGRFLPGTSEVRFVDGGSGASEVQVRQSNRFHRVSFDSTQGKRFLFEPGTEQYFLASLRIRGTASAPLQIASGATAQVSFFNLGQEATQDIRHVGVSDVHATGKPLAIGQTNQGGRGNDRGWFAGIRAEAIPALSPWGLLLLVAMLALFARATPTHRPDSG